MAADTSKLIENLSFAHRFIIQNIAEDSGSPHIRLDMWRGGAAAYADAIAVIDGMGTPDLEQIAKKVRLFLFEAYMAESEHVYNAGRQVELINILGLIADEQRQATDRKEEP